MASWPRPDSTYGMLLAAGMLNVAETMLDTRGLQCPLPVLRARKAIQKLAPGALLRVLATDPGTVKDFRAFCQATGHELVESASEAGEFRFLIRKAAA
jgi:tRNA 2-thiouridine synthesizing protein A